MATNMMDRVEKPEKEETSKEEELEKSLSLSKEILDKDQIEKVNMLKDQQKQDSIMDGSDTDFYTRSMDLSDKDFEMDDEFKEKKMPIAIKIILIIILIAVIAAAGYFVYRNFF